MAEILQHSRRDGLTQKVHTAGRVDTLSGSSMLLSSKRVGSNLKHICESVGITALNYKQLLYSIH